MVISVWRYSHLALAVSSFILLTLAAATGIILAVEPVMQKSQSYKAEGTDTLSLATTIPVLKEKYRDIAELTVDDNGFVIMDQKSYINPLTGVVIGTPQKQPAFFLWVTSFHRSLFLHETGRVITGVAAFLLILIVLSGIILILQRQKRFFGKVEKGSFAQYYHVVFGRWMLIPMLAIACTGTYLTLARFVFPPAKIILNVDDKSIKEDPALPLSQMTFFQQTKLSEVKSISFPFSEFPEDYYTIKLKDRELAINQITGDILSEVKYPAVMIWQDISLRWHTGRSGMLWAIILAISSGYILFFIYSGFAITLKRRAGLIKNKFSFKQATTIILVGSENGSTYTFAGAVYQQLIERGEQPYIAGMDAYTLFPSAKQLIIMTSTYGLGEAPANAKHFYNKLLAHPQQQSLQFTVLGFGSKSYPDFCNFAIQVDQWMRAQPWAVPLSEVMTVDDQSLQDFNNWLKIRHFEPITGLSAKRPLKKMKVIHKTDAAHGDAFVVRLRSRQRIVSGDLLAIYPANDHRERLYSIGKVNRKIQLSVKRHENGLGSGYLHGLEAGEIIYARIVKNQHFRFPKNARRVLMIANGTGIAPFIGMVHENGKKVHCHLYWGVRTQADSTIFENELKDSVKTFQLALSREGLQQYVGDLLKKDKDLVWTLLAMGGNVMICGSLAMQRDVFVILDTILKENNGPRVEELSAAGRILTDCY